MAINRVYAGGAVQTIARGAFTPTVPGAGGTFTVDDDTGYPSTGPFPVRLNRGLSDEEHVLISSRAGKVFTIGQRGFDGTTAQSHNDPTCEIYWDATTANLVVDHVDDLEADPHATKLLNNARHDLPARHVYGGANTAFGTRPTPSSVGTANAAGSSNTPAAGDHVHDIANGAIDSSALFAAGVVNLAALAADSVDASKIVNGTITNAEMAANSISLANMTDNSVGTAEINDSTVTNAKLTATAVTQSKVASEAPTAYTPTWNASGVAPAIGNGSLVGTYVKWGRLVFFTMEMVAGTTTTFGTGTYEFGLPVASALGAGAPLAALTIMNNSGTRFVGINIQAGTNQRFRTLERLSLDDIAHNAPFTWGTGDFIQVTGAYFAAA